jgi:DNA sulfur modification protein DndD
LDSRHRIHLVERYFPVASHQVVLLSTDEEVNEKYYGKLKPALGRSYRLEFEEGTQSTSVTQGYFW